MQTKLLSTLLISSSLAAQGLLVYDAGPIVTHPGMGPGGGDASALENATLALNIYGYGAQQPVPNAMVDDFTTNGVWIIDGVEFFPYQTNATGVTMTGVHVEIFNGNPATGGVPIAGSPGIANNLFNTVGYTATATMTNIYRTLETTLGTSVARQLQSVRVDFPAPLILDPAVTGTSTYWLEFNFQGSTAFSGPWYPPITVLGSAATGVAQQRQGTAYVATTSGAALFGQGIPFRLYGTPTTPAGAISNLGGGCGAATLNVRGAPHIGGVVHAALTNTQSPLNPAIFPLIIIGVANQNIPLPCGCVVGPTLDFVYSFAAQPYTNNWQVPVDLSGLGLEYFVQGAELDFFGLGVPPLGCNLGLGFTFALTDTYRVKFY